MGFSDLLESVGGVGYFQILQSALLLLPCCLIACHNFLQNFTAAIPDHHCQVQSHANQTSSSNRTWSLEPGSLLQALIPLDRHRNPEKCLQFSTPQWYLLHANDTAVNATGLDTEPCTDGWTYDRSVFATTIVTEWDLVCDAETLRDLAQSIYMVGVLVGAGVFGSLSYRFGRRLPLICSYLQIAIAGTCTAFAPNFSSYCAFRFLAGMTFSGIMLNSLSLILEWMPTKGRTVAGALLGYFFTFGQMVLVGVAYQIRHWRRLQLYISVPFFAVFLYSWWLPESARWLMLHHKPRAAIKNLKKVSAINGRKQEGERLTGEVSRTLAFKSTRTIFDLFRTPALRRITCCLMLVWFSSAFSYYGLAMDLQKFGLSIYLVQVIFGAIDIPTMMVSTAAMISVGRRLTTAAFLILAGLMVVANVFVPEEMQVLRTAQAALGKGCLASSFTGAYLYSGELYTTEIRQTGLGFVSMTARLGAMVAPFVYVVRNYFPVLPPIIFGAVPFMAGMAAFFLMETRNSSLPETIQELETRKTPFLEKGNYEEIVLQQMVTSPFRESL
uniref:Major facilitator superfamily (MFS) profile domain-containing protein n=1 Tax=Sphenodon punctatus TaxID=8508 RepID=A0A8D0L1H7_SPHPU